jgi:hypothetical protein
MTADFFRNRLDQMIDMHHPLVVLANRMPWQELEASLAHRFAGQVRAGNCQRQAGACQSSCRLIRAHRGALSSADTGVWMVSNRPSHLSRALAIRY